MLSGLRLPSFEFPQLLRLTIVLAGVLGFTSADAQKIINVPADQPTVQAGIDAASTGDTVRLYCGTYYEHVDFKGKAIPVVSPTVGDLDDAEQNACFGKSTIIDAGGIGSAVSFISGEGRDSVLDSITVMHGGPPLPGTPGGNFAGGGVYVYRSAPTFRQVFGQYNTCVGLNVYQGAPFGFGAYFDYTATSPNCPASNGVGVVFRGVYPDPNATGIRPQLNIAARHNQGRGVELYDANPILNQGVIGYNGTGGATAPANGSGLLVVGGGATVINTGIVGNVSTGAGAGIAVVPSSNSVTPAQFVNLTIYGNIPTDQSVRQLSVDGTQVSVAANYPTIFVNDAIDYASSSPLVGCGPAVTLSGRVLLVLDHDDLYNKSGPSFGSTCLPQDGYGNISTPFTVNVGGGSYTAYGDGLVDVGNNSAALITQVPFYGYSPIERIADGMFQGFPIVDIGSGEQGGFLYDGTDPNEPIAPTFVYPDPFPYSVPTGSTYNMVARLSCAAETPSGVVQFYEDGQSIGAGTLDATGVARHQTPPLSAGSHALLATYDGAGSCSIAESVKAWLYVTGPVPTVTTTTSLASSVNPSAQGQPVTFTIQVAAPTATVIPDGTVALSDSGAVIATLTLNAQGTATLTTSALLLGSHTVAAVYSPGAPGATSQFSSSSASLLQVVSSGEISSLSLFSSLNPSVRGQTVTFDALLSTASGDVPTGTVEFFDGSVSLGTATVNISGDAALSAASLTIGSHAISAVYTPAGTDFIASRGSLTQVVTGVPTSSILAVTPTTASRLTSVVLSATVASASTLSAAVPTGTVAFLQNSTTIATATLLSGKATYTTSALPAGSQNITCVYYGDATFMGSQCNTVTVTINKRSQSITFPPPPTPVSLGTPPILLSGTATSGLTVSFSVLSGPGTINGNLLTLTGVGTVIVAADQAGDANYDAATEVTRTVVVTGRVATLTLSATPNPVFLTNPVTITATLSAASGAPSGTVTFLDGGTPIHVSTVSANGEAFTTTSLTLGSHAITAVYSGDAAFAPATSAAITIVVLDFALTTQKADLTIVHGGTAAYSLLLGTATGTGLASTVQLSVTGAPDQSVVTFSPASVPTGSVAVPVTLTIQTPNYPTSPFNAKTTAPEKLTFALLLAGAVLLPWRKRMARVGLLGKSSGIALLFIALASTTLTGCGSGWRTQHWNMTVTATSGSLNRTVNLTLTSECRNLSAACPIEQ